MPVSTGVTAATIPAARAPRVGATLHGMAESSRAQRAQARARWPLVRVSLAAHDSAELLMSRSATERVAMVWALTLDAWAMRGESLPDYPRALAPGRVLRPPASV
jgi:hypothetical protein